LEIISEGEIDIRTVDGIVEKYQGKRTALISMLHDIQNQYRHLPEKALRRVALRLKMDFTDIYGVATFYKAFSLTPKGKHSLTLCLGTACHVRGGPRVLREVKKLVGIEPGQTTGAGHFSLEAVNCLGVCATGPVMSVDGKIHGEMTVGKARRMIAKMKPKGNGGRA
jgi:NADH-quinone oxidoreductase subunit E